MTGEGEPFKEGSAPTQNQTNTSGKKNNYTLTDCESLGAERDSLAKQVEMLNGQLQMQKTIIEGKDQMLNLLKGRFNRPN
ncbi:MAG: hypothetical protein EOO60_09645 [Hymenobacter sp.]|nr:MAG: hypothetical protein EOO60_09645 [Hymenobacter sp.]